MLNTLTLLKDGQPGYNFNVTPQLFSPDALKNDVVARRLEYLAP
jgi:hypothetical protein